MCFRKYEVTIRHSCKPSTRGAPTKAKVDVPGTQHFEDLHNTSVDLMASHGHVERPRGALAVALVVFLTYENRHRARTLVERALVLDVLDDMETAEGEESEDGDDPRFKRTRQVYPRSDFSQAPWSIMRRKPELRQRDSGEYRNFRRHFLILYEFFLELIQLANTENVSHWLQGAWQGWSVYL